MNKKKRSSEDAIQGPGFIFCCACSISNGEIGARCVLEWGVVCAGVGRVACWSGAWCVQKLGLMCAIVDVVCAREEAWCVLEWLWCVLE